MCDEKKLCCIVSVSFLLFRHRWVSEAGVCCSLGPLALSWTMPRKRRTFWGKQKKKSRSPTVLPVALCLFFFMFLRTSIYHSDITWRENIFFFLLLICFCFISFQVGAGWIGKCECSAFIPRKCLHASMIFISPWFTSTVCVWYSPCNDLFICVCPCV